MAFIKEGIIILAVLVLALTIIILIIYESKLKKTLSQKKDSQNSYYRKKLKKISLSQNPEEVLDKIDSLSKEFFKEAFGLECSKECSELIDEFSNLGNNECVEFCRLMISLAYAGEKASNEKLKEIASILDKIILKNKIPSKAEIGAKSTKKPLKEEKKVEDQLKEIKTEKAKPEKTAGKKHQKKKSKAKKKSKKRRRA